MTPEKRVELTTQLADHGLSVLLTKDFDAILIQLARLAQFERLIVTAAEGNPRLADAVKMARLIQDTAAASESHHPLAILDIPTIIIDLHRALHDMLDKQACIAPLRVHAAVAAFTGIIRAEQR
jgi:hypothetical protein